MEIKAIHARIAIGHIKVAYGQANNCDEKLKSQ